MTCKYAIPRYGAIFWQHGMAQVRNNAGDLRRIVIVRSWLSDIYETIMAQEAAKNLHLRHQETWSVSTSYTTKRLACGTGLREDASCTCPVSFCLLVTYNFFPKDARVGKMLESIEY